MPRTAQARDWKEGLTKLQASILERITLIRGSRYHCGYNQHLLTRILTPAKAKRADYSGSRKAAIEQHCITCCGGSRKAASYCRSFDCHLWRFRPNPQASESDLESGYLVDPVTPPHGYNPTEADYDALLEDKTSDAQRQHRERMREILSKDSENAT